MTDPAIAAAQRAWIERYGDLRRFDEFCDGDTGIAAFVIASAREMAKSVQELIAEARTWKPYSTRDIGDAYCAGTVEDFLDELSKRVYPSEEL
ncbi:hypothetical protein [Mycobacteroides abscessus]|uniref:hypothetical protein n=1 Tax=Mycobacteroides abscessus TaxID=36809 RepID=UPI0005E0EAAC|nr:hypothetical protein [Mycobacteroides abscessus]CPS10736.1 Uncharacterised protein [Mycobacteroides abscessus]CPU99732.1 Uncharacterised protein [Mycobacteroides abscessus]